MIQKLELTCGTTVKVKINKKKPVLQILIDKIYEFPLYQEIELREVFDTIDESPYEESINIEEVIEETEIYDDYETFLDTNLGMISRMFVEIYLDKLNKQRISEYQTDSKYITEEMFLFGMVIFDGENNDEFVEELNKIQGFTIDNDELVQKVLDSEEWENYQEVFYIIKYSIKSDSDTLE